MSTAPELKVSKKSQNLGKSFIKQKRLKKDILTAMYKNNRDKKLYSERIKLDFKKSRICHPIFGSIIKQEKYKTVKIYVVNNSEGCV